MTVTAKLNDIAPTRRRFTRAEYMRAAETGVFGPEERLELINGEVVEKMSPQKSSHTTGVYLLQEVLRKPFGQGYLIRVQSPLAVNSTSELEPDIAVVKGKWQEFRNAHPTTAVLIVEVADTSLEFDRTVKAALYASAGVPEYWVLNVIDRELEVRRDPVQAEERWNYNLVTVYAAEGVVTPLGAEHELAVRDLLP